ncbi:hypothetical protein [Mesorhizobium sp.]|uniref:hypothetical protein n=1 Tax=Mesorhizobium sp. TaxID=1871066 RepID=UPI00257B54F9|nr:hypothetical protein [Mesorhizobium sp.]
MTNWHKIEDYAPPQRELVMVTGPSGYVTHTKFLELAYVDEEYRPSRGGALRWQTVTNDALSDCGFYPTHWARIINLPEQA